MPKYKKRPIVVAAFLLDAKGANYEDWFLQALAAEDKIFEHRVGSSFWLSMETPEGVMLAKPGDYIIRGIAGEIYPCKADIFCDTYEEWDGERGIMTNRDYLVGIINKQLRYCDLVDCRKCSYGGNSCNQAEAIADRLMEADYLWPQWISVKDGLPEPGENVLVQANGTVGQIAYDNDIVYAYHMDEGCFLDNLTNVIIPEVTHWMPKPEPPKGE